MDSIGSSPWWVVTDCLEPLYEKSVIGFEAMLPQKEDTSEFDEFNSVKED